MGLLGDIGGALGGSVGGAMQDLETNYGGFKQKNPKLTRQLENMATGKNLLSSPFSLDPVSMELASIIKGGFSDPTKRLGQLGPFGPSASQLALRQQQAELLSRRQALEKQMSDVAAQEIPSIAEMQLRQAQESALQDQLAAIASARGVSPELALRQQQMARQEASRGLAREGAILRAAEEQQKREEQRQLRQDLSQMQLGTGQLQKVTADELESDRQAALGRQKLQSQQDIAATQAEVEKSKGVMGLLGGGLAAVGSIFSDKDKKENIEDGSTDINELLENLDPKKFNYKDDPKNQEILGVLAQDLEKSKIGKNMVLDTKDGKQVDMAKAFSMVLAANADMHKRIKKLEGDK